MINIQNKMALKVTKKAKYATVLYHKINATRSTFYMESFMLFKPGTHRPAAGVRLVSYNCFHSAKVCVCVYAPEAINN